jgi:voltage-dependent potassium channel beta subunit
MNFRRLGSSGLKVSELSLGAWVTYGGQVDQDVTTRCVQAAYERGVNLFDNADMYANGNAEVVVGKAVKALPRTDLVLSTKVFFPMGKGPNARGLSRKHIFESIHSSLKRLGTDYVDLYFCHRFDPETPVGETVHVMSDLVRQGKVLYWGTSEWTAAQIESAHAAAREIGGVPPSMEQPQYNLYRRGRVERDLKGVCERLGIGLTTWSPLAFGLLTGKYNDGVPQGSRATLHGYEWLREENLTEERLAKARAYTGLAREAGLSPAQLAIAWCLRTPTVSSVITGASRAEQVHENLAAIDIVPQLTPELLAGLDAVFGPGKTD